MVHFHPESMCSSRTAAKTREQHKVQRRKLFAPVHQSFQKGFVDHCRQVFLTDPELAC